MNMKSFLRGLAFILAMGCGEADVVAQERGSTIGESQTSEITTNRSTLHDEITKKYILKRGDSVWRLRGKFCPHVSWSLLTQRFQIANPEIGDIGVLYEGGTVNIPSLCTTDGKIENREVETTQIQSVPRTESPSESRYVPPTSAQKAQNNENIVRSYPQAEQEPKIQYVYLERKGISPWWGAVLGVFICITLFLVWKVLSQRRHFLRQLGEDKRIMTGLQGTVDRQFHYALQSDEALGRLRALVIPVDIPGRGDRNSEVLIPIDLFLTKKLGSPYTRCANGNPVNARHLDDHIRECPCCNDLCDDEAAERESLEISSQPLQKVH